MAGEYTVELDGKSFTGKLGLGAMRAIARRMGYKTFIQCEQAVAKETENPGSTDFDLLEFLAVFFYETFKRGSLKGDTSMSYEDLEDMVVLSEFSKYMKTIAKAKQEATLDGEEPKELEPKEGPPPAPLPK